MDYNLTKGMSYLDFLGQDDRPSERKRTVEGTDVEPPHNVSYGKTTPSFP